MYGKRNEEAIAVAQMLLHLSSPWFHRARELIIVLINPRRSREHAIYRNCLTISGSANDMQLSDKKLDEGIAGRLPKDIKAW